MRKPVYKHPNFVIETKDKRTENKRYWLTLKIDKKKNDNIVVILKNPSRATKDISDKTVFNVTNYIHKNRDRYKPLKNVGTIIILNLIPFYETYSHKLSTNVIDIQDKNNLKVIKNFTSKYRNVIIAWGDNPKGLYQEYENIKTSIYKILKKNKNKIFYIDRLSKSGNPKHGQIWAYKNRLLPFKINDF